MVDLKRLYRLSDWPVLTLVFELCGHLRSVFVQRGVFQLMKTQLSPNIPSEGEKKTALSHTVKPIQPIAQHKQLFNL